MKNLFLFTFLTITLNLFAQKPVQMPPIQKDHGAEYIGGMANFYAYLGRELKYPSSLSRNNISGKIKIRFRVTAKGNVDSVSLVNSPGRDWDAMFVHALEKTSGQWRPAKRNGKRVADFYYLPIACVYPE